MVYHKKRAFLTAAILALPLILSGCGAPTVDVGTTDHTKLMADDRKLAEQNTQYEFTLEQALERGVKYNLDARVAALQVVAEGGNVTLEKLKALPSLTYSKSQTQRSNNGASSSKSVLSGLQSLEPSQSTDRQRQSAELQSNWNLIDAALAISESRTASDNTRIASERYNKVIHNIERDIYAAYWRALVIQRHKSAIIRLMAEGRRQIDNLDAAAAKKLIGSDDLGQKSNMLAERMRNLRDQYEALAMAQSELRGLLSIPQSADIILLEPSNTTRKKYEQVLKQDLKTKEWSALQNRPEMREEIYQRNISLRDIREEVLKTFPGGELLFSYNYDSNSFLSDADWTSFTAKLVQNILNIFTLPARYQAAENKAELTNARRQALNAAIIAQVHIAQIRLNNLADSYKDYARSAATMEKRAKALNHKSTSGFASGGDAVMAQIDGLIERMRADMREADVQDAYAAMVNSLGERVSER